MAVVVGLVVGFVLALRLAKLQFAFVLVAPVLVAALEIAVNTIRFGVASMVVWAPLLLALTVGATALGQVAGRRVGARWPSTSNEAR